jgi:HAD superfamily hydrolase (TIGR01509 family)
MIDSESLYFETEREMARSYGRDVRDETLRKMMGRSPADSMKVFADDLNLAVSPEELAGIREERMAIKLVAHCPPLTGLFEIIEAFRGNLKMAVATGSPPRFLTIVIQKLSLQDTFQALVTSDDVARGKPEPDIYLLAARRLNTLPERCIVLEDSENGARAGKRAGCHVIAVPTLYTDSGDFSFVHYRASDLLDAMAHIQRHGNHSRAT